MNRLLTCSVLGLVVVVPRAHASDPWADAVVSYAPGVGATPGYTDPLVSLGEPTRFTGVGVYPSAVTPFNPAFMASEIVSIGNGGVLIVAFDQPVTNDASNPFGIDLLVFGNSFFSDTNYPTGTAGPLSGGTGTIEVSSDGVNWTLVSGTPADGLFPTIGYSDLTDPYALVPGSVPSDFTKPADPSLALAGLDYLQILAAYAGSGGGAGVDLGVLGLSEISFVRISGAAGVTVEIDGLSDVAPIPAPSVGILALTAIGSLAGRRRRVVG
jgi:hypothetical protein